MLIGWGWETESEAFSLMPNFLAKEIVDAQQRAQPRAELGAVGTVFHVYSTFKPWLEMHAGRRAQGAC